MAVVLEGGCRVTTMREGEPRGDGTVTIWHQVGRETGAQAISLRVLEFAAGMSKPLRNQSADEVLYALGGHGTMTIGGRTFAIEPEMGIYIRPGESFSVENLHAEPIVLVSSRCPEPGGEEDGGKALPAAAKNSRDPFVRLSDRQAVPTADRWYRVLVDDEVGSRQVTQFVGSIPPGRAPDHFHKYEEVLFILRGEGVMWAGETSTPIAAGSCVYLPRGQVHCVENTAEVGLQLLGVFYPAGSPAVRYEAE